MKSEILRQLFFVVGWTSITFANPPKFIQSGSATIAYYEEGRREGTPLVVIAGGPGFDHDYLRIGKGWEQLIAEHRVVFYDQRGTGHSSPVTPEISITVTDFVADLEALREVLGLDAAGVNVASSIYSRSFQPINLGNRLGRPGSRLQRFRPFREGFND